MSEMTESFDVEPGSLAALKAVERMSRNLADRYESNWRGRLGAIGDQMFDDLRAALDAVPATETTASTLYPRVKYGWNAPPSVEDAPPARPATDLTIIHIDEP